MLTCKGGSNGFRGAFFRSGSFDGLKGNCPLMQLAYTLWTRLTVANSSKWDFDKKFLTILYYNNGIRQRF